MKEERKKYCVECRGEPNHEYTGCHSCIHSEDSSEICFMRRCIHAMHNTIAYEFYEKKQEVEHE